MVRRRRRDFRGIVDGAGALRGLSATRGEHLRLAAAWRRAAGDALSRHVEPSAWSRGTLTLRARDAHWADAVRPLLGELLGRVARDCAAVELRRYRLEHPGGRDEPREVVPAPAEPGPGRVLRRGGQGGEAGGGAGGDPVPDPVEARRRLERLRDRYLDAASGRSAG